MIYYGRTLRGLEDLAAEELAARFGARIQETGHREIFFSGVAPGDLADSGLLDDVFILCGELDGIDHTRASLDKLREKAAGNLPAVRRAFAQRSGKPSSLKVVASFLGRRNYNRYEIEAAVGEPLARGLGLRLFTGSEEEADAVLRVHLRDGGGILALRLFDRPLRQRAYKKAHYPAATPPQVGRALAMLAQLQPGMRVLDPYCGTGTVLIESALLRPGVRLWGGDLALESLLGARINAAAAGVSASWCRMSALLLGYEDGCFDRIVSNVPWGRQVSHAGDEEAAWRELRRVLHPGGLAAVLVHDREGSHPGFAVESERPLRLYGQTSWLIVLRPLHHAAPAAGQ